MYTQKTRGRREGGTDERTDEQTYRWMERERENRELHAKLEERDRGSEAGGASDFFFKRKTLSKATGLYTKLTSKLEEKNKTKQKILLTYFSGAEQEVRRRARDWRG